MDQLNLLGKYAAHLCYDLSSSYNEIYITHSSTFCKLQRIDDYTLNFLIVVLKSGENARLMICDVMEPWGYHTSIILKEINENLGTKLGNKFENLSPENVQHCVIFPYFENSKADDIKELSNSFQTEICKDRIYKIMLKNDSRIDHKFVTIISNFVLKNNDEFLNLNGLPENFLELEITAGNGDRKTIREMIGEISVVKTNDVPIYENPVMQCDYMREIIDAEKDIGLLLVRNDNTTWSLFGYPKVSQNAVVETIEDVLETTRILVSDTVEFDEVCKIRDEVHEIEWQHFGFQLLQSKNNRSLLGEFLHRHQYGNQPKTLPNIQVVKGVGKTSYCQALKETIIKEDCTKMIKCLEDSDFERVLSKIDNTKQTLMELLQTKTKIEEIVFHDLVKMPKKINVTVDNLHRLDKHQLNVVVKLIKDIHKQFPLISVSIMATEKLYDHLETCLGIASFNILPFNENQRRALIQKRIPEISKENVDQLWNKISEDNFHYEFDPFFVDLCIGHYKENGLETSYYSVFLFENYIKNQLHKTLKSKGIDEYEKLETEAMKASFEMIFNEGSSKVLDSIFGGRQQNRLAEFLAAKYVLKMPNTLLPQILPLKYSNNVLIWFDRILNKYNSSTGCSNINNTNKDQFQQTVEHLAAMNEKDGTSLVDIAADCIFKWTPIRWAEERSNWIMVNQFLGTEGNSQYLHKIRNMTSAEINELLPNVFCHKNIVSYILAIRSDIRVSQKMLWKVFVDHQNADTIKQVLKLACQQNIGSDFQYEHVPYGSALHSAVAHISDTEIIRTLVEDLHFSITKENDKSFTPIAYATSIDVVKYLLNCEERFQLQDKDKNKLFLNACWFGNIEIMKFCIYELHVDIKCLGEGGATAMHYACRGGKLEPIKLLFQSGFTDFNIRNEIGETPIFDLTYDDSKVFNALVYQFIKHGADLTVVSNYGGTIVNKFLENEDTFLLGLSLSKKRATVDISLLCENFLLGKIQEIELEFRIHWNEYRQEATEKTFLVLMMDACSDIEFFKYVARKCDLKVQDKYGVTPLMRALNERNPQYAKVLLTLGADIHQKNNDGESAIHYAVKSRHKDFINLIISKLDLKEKDKYGKPIVNCLLQTECDQEFAQYLVRNGMDVNAVDNNGRTALHSLIIQDCDKCRLIAALDILKVDPGLLDNRKRLAIHYLAESKGIHVLDAIKAYGERCEIDFDAKDEDGKTVLDLVKNATHGERYDEKPVLDLRNWFLIFRRKQNSK